MNTAELAAKLAEAHGLSKAQAKSIVDDVLKDIVDAAAGGAEVSLPGFGKFKVKTTPEREGRNPSSGEKIKIAASRKLTFSLRQIGQGPPERLRRRPRRTRQNERRGRSQGLTFAARQAARPWKENLSSPSRRAPPAISSKPEFSLLCPANRGTRASPHPDLRHESDEYQSLAMNCSCNG